MISKKEDYFYASNGAVLRNKKDLLEFLKSIDESVYASHVNEIKNDFAKWTLDILEEKSLAKRMQESASKSQMIVAIEETMKHKTNNKKDRKSVILQLVEAIKHG